MRIGEEEARGFFGGLTSSRFDERAIRDFLGYSTRRLVKTFNLIAPDVERSQRILELACPPYLFSALLKHRFPTKEFHFTHYARAERIPIPVQISHAKLGETYTFRPEFVDLERDPYPFDSQSFDVVIAMEIIEHFPRDPFHFIQEVNRVLKVGGRFLVTTPNVASFVALRNWWRHGHPSGSRYNRHDFIGHPREYSLEELVRILRLGGFHIRYSTSDFVFLAPGPLYSLLFAILDPHRRRRDLCFVIGEKVTDEVIRYLSEFYE